MQNFSWEDLVGKIRSSGVLKSSNIIKALLKIKRRDFLPPESKDDDNSNAPLSIGCGQTNSQPATVAFMLELLAVHPGHRVLEIGSGSGWVTALLAELCSPNGRVTGIEIIPELVSLGRQNIGNYQQKNIEIRQANHEALGLPGELFDRILVSAAAPQFPQELVDQLKPGGIMVIPVQSSIFRINKTKNGEIRKKEFYGFSFVPLIMPYQPLTL